MPMLLPMHVPFLYTLRKAIADILPSYLYSERLGKLQLLAALCGGRIIADKPRSGSMTEGYLDGREDTWTCAPQTTTGNVCVDDQRLNSDGTVDSETIFVKTDCVTRQPLPDGQDPVYGQPGVPLDRGQYDIMAENWQSVGEASQGLAASTPQCGANPYTMPVADVTTASNQLDAMGDQDCCSQTDGSCINISAVNGRAVDLCGKFDGTQLCANCARVANYVAGLTTCVDGNGNVGAIQDVVETPGLTVQI